MSHRDDSYKYYGLWRQYFTFIKKLNLIKNLQKCALVIENSRVVYDKNTYDIPNVSVIKQIFQSDSELPFTLEHEIDINSKKNYTVLIYKKRLEEQ